MLNTKTLVLAALSSDPAIAETMSSLAPRTGFEHKVIRAGQYRQDMLLDADIAVIDAACAPSPPKIRQIMKNGSILIVCMTPEEEKAFEGWMDVDDIWIIPVLQPRAALRLNAFLDRIWSERESILHNVWLETLIDSMPDLVWFKSPDGTHHKVNKGFANFIGKPLSAIEGRKHCDIWDIPMDECEQSEFVCRQSEDAAIASGGTHIAEEVVKSGNTLHLFKTYKTALRWSDGTLLGTVGFAQDMTNFLNLGMELDLFINAMPFPVMICGKDNRIRKVNSSFLEFFDETAENCLNQYKSRWLARKMTLETSPASGKSHMCFARSGKPARFVEMNEKLLEDIFGENLGHICIFRDITIEKELENQIWRNANVDALTGLSNRYAFQRHLKQLDPSRPVSIFYIDLDDFKKINDTYGHKVGDEALKIMAKSLKAVFGQDFPGRIGGDEFVVCVQRDVPPTEIIRLAGRLLDRCREKFGAELFFSGLGVSIGVRMHAIPGCNVELLLKQADDAMYMAKKEGKNRFVIWSQEMEIHPDQPLASLPDPRDVESEKPEKPEKPE